MTETTHNDAEENNSEEISKELVERVKISANYCYNCNKCVNVCPLSHLGVFSPRNLIADLTYLPIEEVIERNDIWQCLTCGQCTVYCPMTQETQGVKIPELILELRKLFKDHGTEIDKLQQCETHDGVFPIISKLMIENPKPPNKLEFVDNYHLKTRTSGEIAYFVGCVPLMEDIIYNFDNRYINSPVSIISLLNEAGIAPVVLNEKCCGHDTLWGEGNVETFKKLAEYNVELYKKAGVKKVIVGCAEGYRTWKIDYPNYVENFDFKVCHFSEFVLQNKLLDNLRFPDDNEVKVTYHDACRIGRLGGKLYNAPRELLRKIPGVKLIEMENIRDDASCCGVSAFKGCNEYTRVLRGNRIEEAIRTGAEYLVVPCPKCLTHFNCYINEPTLKLNEDGPTAQIKVIDLATFLGLKLYLI